MNRATSLLCIFLPTLYFAQINEKAVTNLYSISSSLSGTIVNSISLTVDATWLASELTGTETTTGSLTQANNGNWSYSSSPADKLVATFSDGSSFTVTIFYIDGYKDGDAEDFKNSHNLDFSFSSGNLLNERITSVTTPVEGSLEWERKLSGKVLYADELLTCNVEFSGKKVSEVVSGYASQTVDEVVKGEAIGVKSSYLLNDQFHVALGHNSNLGLFARDKQLWENSSITYEGKQYTFSGLNIFYVSGTQFSSEAEQGIYNQPIDIYQWSAEGSLLVDNSELGKIEFFTPTNSANGPILISNQGGGNQIILDYLLNSTPTETINENVLQEFRLAQNYPNPFNPTTTIEYDIPISLSTEKISLSIYNSIGEFVETLFDNYQSFGTHKVTWNATNRSTGVYFYILTIGNNSIVKKMILLK